MEMLQLHSKQETEELKAQAVQAKEELSRLKECCAEQLLSMKTEHLRVLDHLCATHALEHSSSKVAELTNKLNSQEIAMRHLQEQLTELQGSKEALTISQSKEETLQRQVNCFPFPGTLHGSPGYWKKRKQVDRKPTKKDQSILNTWRNNEL
ncbi:centrosomal protein of 162 kDa-like [Kryptolebias marmoratus]|uniref:centrosomal protein of 162 kDa-like n=1 Tax=Kryptolebias marmoratus TaxID=37003 RepID=UPI0018ACB731|nr:centrosomal protein of 162 kDa-like [Kryptolebias marmoratus]